MKNRIRALRGATGLLYLGPLLAGACGAGWSVIPVFVALFLLWLVVLRPQDWPQSLEDWQSPDAWIGLTTRVVVQFVLVLLCYGVGAGFAGVTGLPFEVPLVLPVLLSLAAVPLARLAWPDTLAVANLFLQESYGQPPEAPVEDGQPGSRARRRDIALQLAQPMIGLPAETRTETIAAHLRALATHVAADDLFEALLDCHGAGPDRPALRRALILHATSPQTVEACPGRAAPVVALQVAGREPELLRLFADCCRQLLDQHADAWGECPNQSALEAARRGADGAAAEALARLIAMNRSLAPLAAEVN